METGNDMTQHIKIGVDGCKGGWFYAASVGAKFETGIVESVVDLFGKFQSIEEMIIDIPIGLHNDGAQPRNCDIEARKILKPRGSTVFPAPLRPSIYTSNYTIACNVNQQLSGKKLPIQAFNIAGKIREVDQLLTQCPKYRCVIKEAHPELGFCMLNKCIPLETKKKRTAGINQRLMLLNKVIPETYEIYSEAIDKFQRKTVARDDIVDALLCLAISMSEKSNRVTVPSYKEYDDVGLEMVMHSINF